MLEDRGLRTEDRDYEMWNAEIFDFGLRIGLAKGPRIYPFSESPNQPINY
jgi:hypothetical protein